MEINLFEFIKTEALWIIPVLMIFGQILKNIPVFKDWLIPITLFILGLILGYIFIEQSSVGLLQGLLSATASVGIHQGIKQPVKNYKKK